MSIQEITAENIDAFLSGFDTVLTDCDGVLWHGSIHIDGASQTIQKLHKMEKKIFYLTNNSSKTREEYVTKCTQMNMPAVKEDIVGTAYVAAQYVYHTLGYRGTVYVVGSTGIEGELREVGIKCVGVGPDYEDKTYDEMAEMELDPEINCVVVGLDKYFCYNKLAKATRYLAREGCHFVATNMDSCLPTGGNTVLPGSGSMVTAVETVSERTADVVVGKPHPPMFDIMATKYNLDPARTLMIGDRLSTDIEFAGRCGLQSLLVLSGFSTMQEVESKRKDGLSLQLPTYYVESLGKLGEIIAKAGLSM